MFLWWNPCLKIGVFYIKNLISGLFLKIGSLGNQGSPFLHGHSQWSWEAAQWPTCDRAGNLPTIPRVLNIFRPQKTFTYLASLLQTVFLMSEKGALYIISPHIRLLSQYTLIIPKGWKIYSWLTIAVPLGGVREDRKHWHSRWWDWEPSELLLPSQGQLPGAERPYSWEVLGPFSCIFLCKIFQMLGAVAVKFSSIRKICVNLPQDRYDCL